MIQKISPIKFALIGSIFFLLGIFGYSFLFLHWLFGPVSIIFLIGCTLLYVSYYKGKFNLRLLPKLKKLYVIILIVSLIMIVCGGIYIFNYDSTYEIKYKVISNSDDRYTLFLPLPSDEDDNIYEAKDLANIDSIIYESDYGPTLRIDSNSSFNRKLSGRCGNSHFTTVSTSTRKTSVGDCWVFLDSNNLNLTLHIYLDFNNDSPGSGSDGHISAQINGNGWHKVSFRVGFWII